MQKHNSFALTNKIKKNKSDAIHTYTILKKKKPKVHTLTELRGKKKLQKKGEKITLKINVV